MDRFDIHVGDGDFMQRAGELYREGTIAFKHRDTGEPIEQQSFMDNASVHMMLHKNCLDETTIPGVGESTLIGSGEIRHPDSDTIGKFSMYLMPFENMLMSAAVWTKRSAHHKAQAEQGKTPAMKRANADFLKFNAAEGCEIVSGYSVHGAAGILLDVVTGVVLENIVLLVMFKPGKHNIGELLIHRQRM